MPFIFVPYLCLSANIDVIKLDFKRTYYSSKLYHSLQAISWLKLSKIKVQFDWEKEERGHWVQQERWKTLRKRESNAKKVRIDLLGKHNSSVSKTIRTFCSTEHPLLLTLKNIARFWTDNFKCEIPNHSNNCNQNGLRVVPKIASINIISVFFNE